MPEAAKTKPRAYSYVRFSTPEQMKGDGYRRQTALAREYAQRHGLELDEGLTFEDLGISAFHGRNMETGHLGEFLQAVRSGHVPRGSYLLVESLDRISRRAARKALRALEDICDENITVVTLADGREYTKDNLDNDPTSLLMSILIFMRANEESAMKARRLRAVWANKRANAGAKPLTAACPAWLTLDREKRSFSVIAERAKIIKRIFRETLKGTGQQAIARALNEQGVKPFEGKYWHRSYVAKITGNPAVVGTYVPHHYVYEDGKRTRKPLDPVPDYYPAVVHADDFQRAQAMKASRNPLRGRHAAKGLQNLIGGLTKCLKCGDAMQRVSKGGAWVYLVCASARGGKGCEYRAVRYADVESTLLKRFRQLAKSCPAPKAEGTRLEKQMVDVDAAISEVTDQINALLDAVERTGKRPASALARIEELEQELDALRAKEKGLQAQVDALSPLAVKHKVSSFLEAMSREPLDRVEVNAIMRQMFSGVTVDYERGELVFAWQHGGTTELQYSFPEEQAAA